LLCRKKAKTVESSSTEQVSDKLCISSADKSNKPESENPAKQLEADLPISQYHPLLLSQSGKFIPKFLTKKKLPGDCTVRLERTAPEFLKPANCGDPLSEIEVSLESQCIGHISVADEVQSNSGFSACLDSTVATEDTHNNHERELVVEDSCNDDEPESGMTESRDASNSEQLMLADNEPAESPAGSVREGLPDGIASEAKEMRINDEGANDDQCVGSCDAAAEEKMNSSYTQSGDASGDIQQCITSVVTDQHDVIAVSTKPVSNINTDGSGAAAVAMETGPVSRDEGRTHTMDTAANDEIIRQSPAVEMTYAVVIVDDSSQIAASRYEETNSTDVQRDTKGWFAAHRTELTELQF